MYILIEIQTNNGTTAILPAETFTDRNAAESAYYNKMSFAAVSTVKVHSVILLDEHGNVIKSGYYEHIQET